MIRTFSRRPTNVSLAAHLPPAPNARTVTDLSRLLVIRLLTQHRMRQSLRLLTMLPGMRICPKKSILDKRNLRNFRRYPGSFRGDSRDRSANARGSLASAFLVFNER